MPDTAVKVKRFVDAEYVASDYGCSKSHAYKIIQKLNAELKKQGFIVFPGKVSRRYYEKRTSP